MCVGLSKSAWRSAAVVLERVFLESWAYGPAVDAREGIQQAVGPPIIPSSCARSLLAIVHGTPTCLQSSGDGEDE